MSPVPSIAVDAPLCSCCRGVTNSSISLEDKQLDYYVLLDYLILVGGEDTAKAEDMRTAVNGLRAKYNAINSAW